MGWPPICGDGVCQRAPCGASGHQAPSLKSMESSQAEFDSHLYNTHLYNTHLSDNSVAFLRHRGRRGPAEWKCISVALFRYFSSGSDEDACGM